MPEREGSMRDEQNRVIEEVISDMCDGFCHWPFVCANEDELEKHCDSCPLVRL